MNETLRPIHADRTTTIRAAIVGLGTWGQNLVNSVQGKSDLIRFVAGATRTPARAEDFGRRQQLGVDEAMGDGVRPRPEPLPESDVDVAGAEQQGGGNRRRHQV